MGDQRLILHRAVLFSLLHFLHVFHVATARFSRADKHDVVTAIRADVFDFLVLAFALTSADYFDLAIAAQAGALLTNGHHFHVRFVGAHFMNDNEFTHGAGHGHGVTRFKRFRLRLSLDVVHDHGHGVRHPLHFTFFDFGFRRIH